MSAERIRPAFEALTAVLEAYCDADEPRVLATLSEFPAEHAAYALGLLLSLLGETFTYLCGGDEDEARATLRSAVVDWMDELTVANEAEALVADELRRHFPNIDPR